jgi:hypothetical protein
MTKLNYYTIHSDEALTIATNICKTRRDRAGIPSLCAADVEMERCLILEEWWYDYRNEHV